MAYNILVVDDSRTIRGMVIKTLKLSNIDINEIHEAENGQQGIECLQEHWIDIVLSDLNMPVMTGMEMVKKMHDDNLLKNIPVVIISTDGSSTRLNELKKMGIREYIRKPFTPEALGEVIIRIMGGVNEQAKA